MNIRVVLEYDGSGFAGWQQQARGRTVEAELKRALRELTGADHTVYAAGRTDAGAHAEGQVVSFRTDGRICSGWQPTSIPIETPASTFSKLCAPFSDTSASGMISRSLCPSRK